MLREYDHLVLDCQTTGSNPECGQVLEIGWKRVPASGRQDASHSPIQSFVLRLEEGHPVPRRIQKMTGISEQDIESAESPQKVWKALLKEARQIARQNRMERCPLVIHFSKFEEPFLRDLHQQYGKGREFPFQIICTHDISKRLLPQLPRKGIRAVAGYLGYSVPELKRSAHHVAATVFIWNALVERLSAEGVDDLAKLEEWLRTEPPPKSTAKAYPMNRELRLALPDEPGVYRMLRSNGDVLYVGKAKSLKQRVNSYFRRSGQHGEHIKEMLTQAQDLKVTVTGTALEAALLENDEIKRLAPPYNVALRQQDSEPVFFSNDLTSSSLSPNPEHPVGPIASAGIAEALGRLWQWLALPESMREKLEINAATFLGIPEIYAPPLDCLLDGLRLFQDTHMGDRHPSTRSLLSLGARLWAEHLERLALEAEKKGQASEAVEIMDNGDEVVEEAVEPRIWQPEMVLRSLEFSVRHGTLLMRRARWLTALSESSLCWGTGKSSGNKSGTAVCLSVSEGRIVSRLSLSELSEPPVPPGMDKSPDLKRLCFDRVTYDRLRILTTEMRRLVGTGRPILLRLSSAPPLGWTQLAKMLPWI